MKSIINIKVKNKEKNLRIDILLSNQDKKLSRSRVKSLILENKLKINEKIIQDPSIKTKLNDKIELEIVEPKKQSLKPYNFKLNIIYEDEDLIVIDKPSGISILDLGIFLFFLFLSLYIFGITLGILVSSGLLRFGPSFENIAWSTMFLLAPFGCIYYPIETLPEIFQKIAYVLPLVYIFEEARNILINQTVNIENVYYAFIWNAFYFSLSIALFYYSFNAAKNKGTLINMGE